MDSKLRSYIEEQQRKNVNPENVRHNLAKAGWDSDKVNEALDEIYFHKHHVNGILLAISILAVIVLVGALLIVANYNKEVPDKRYLPPAGGSERVVVLGSNIVQSNSCALIDDSVDKDLCYQDKTKTGYDCDPLKDEVERSFCFRALEYNLINA